MGLAGAGGGPGLCTEREGSVSDARKGTCHASWVAVFSGQPQLFCGRSAVVVKSPIAWRSLQLSHSMAEDCQLLAPPLAADSPTPGSRDRSTWCVTRCLPGCTQAAAMGGRAGPRTRSSDMGCAYPQLHLSCCTRKLNQERCLGQRLGGTEDTRTL